MDIVNYIDSTHTIELLDERIGEAKETLADYRRAYTDFNWQPRTKIKDWLKLESAKT